MILAILVSISFNFQLAHILAIKLTNIYVTFFEIIQIHHLA